eukprot:1160358-Pelagomonas_calceolata.AAC.6
MPHCPCTLSSLGLGVLYPVGPVSLSTHADWLDSCKQKEKALAGPASHCLISEHTELMCLFLEKINAIVAAVYRIT